MMMSRMGDEFPQCPRVHVDWEFTLVDKVTQEIKNRKKFRVLAIQNNTQNYQHAAIIITELGQEYVQIPSMIKKFFSEIPKTVELITRDHFEEKEMSPSSDLRFTGNVYLYTHKLIVPEAIVREHFQENNLMLVLRDHKYWQNFGEGKNPA